MAVIAPVSSSGLNEIAETLGLTPWPGLFKTGAAFLYQARFGKFQDPRPGDLGHVLGEIEASTPPISV